MSPDIEQLLAEHNQEAVDHLVDYISKYVSSHLGSLPPANVLPASGFSYPHKGSATTETAALIQQPLAHGLKEQKDDKSNIHGVERGHALGNFRKRCWISSPFAAQSGNVFPE